MLHKMLATKPLKIDQVANFLANLCFPWPKASPTRFLDIVEKPNPTPADNIIIDWQDTHDAVTLMSS